MKKDLYNFFFQSKEKEKNITCTSYLAQEMWQKPPQKKGINQNTHERLSIGTHLTLPPQAKQKEKGGYVEYLLMLFSHIPNFIITY